MIEMHWATAEGIVQTMLGPLKGHVTTRNTNDQKNFSKQQNHENYIIQCKIDGLPYKDTKLHSLSKQISFLINLLIFLKQLSVLMQKCNVIIQRSALSNSRGIVAAISSVLF